MNNLYLIIIILLIIILFIYHNKFIKICDSDPEIYTYGNDNDLTILIIGGTHGNEPAGYHIINKLMDKLNKYEIKLKKGNLILIPAVNSCGLKLDTRRNYFYTDINRSYNSNNKINKKILEYVKKSDIIIDLHEGWGFHQIDKNSLGSTISMTNWNDNDILKNIILNNVNNTISDDKKKFIYNNLEKNDYNGTLSQYARKNNKKFILVETTGQNDIQTLDIRVNQGMNIINSVLQYNNLI